MSDSSEGGGPIFVELQLDAWIAALGRMSAKNPAMARILHIIDRLQDRPYRTHALFLGEAGTGKDGLARLLFRLMHPDGGACERVFLRGRSEAEMETQLFGGSDGPGVLSRARGGALIIDEILALSPHLQQRLHAALGRQRWTQPSSCVSVLAMSDGDVEDAVQKGSFRHDLYYKLCRLVLRVPPLRDRQEDLGHAAVWMANRVLRERGISRSAELHDESGESPAPSSSAYRISSASIDALRCYDSGWPGNFRELEAVIERAVLLYSDGNSLERDDVDRALSDLVST